MRVLPLSKDLEASIRGGHPWIYARAVRWSRPPPKVGEIVGVSRHGDVLAVGYADPDSPIGVRVLDLDAGARVDEGWVRGRVRSAVAARRADPLLGDVDAVRLIHGENDFMPGLVLDHYRDTAVMVFDGVGAQAMWEPWVNEILDEVAGAGLPLAGSYRRRVRGTDGQGAWLRGNEPTDLVVQEGEARFAVDVVHGQKTGLFLDQRENRRSVSRSAAGADVLNLYCYTGGFSVHAGLAGARRVTSVDVAGPAIEAAKANWSRNGLEAAAHEAVTADVHDFLSQAAEAGRRWDVVVCDPPSFAPSERARQRGLRAYRAVNALAIDRVAPGGLFVSASCSSHVRDADLEKVVNDAARQAGRRGRIVGQSGAASDHPVAFGFPEGRYLDCLWVRLD